MKQPWQPRSVAYEAAEDITSNPSSGPSIGDVIAERLSRRDLVKGLSALAVLGAAVRVHSARAAEVATAGPFRFPELAVSDDATHHVAEGYDARPLIRWGDAVASDVPPFTPGTADAKAQSRQFGYNNDFIGYIPIEGRSDHGLLVVNHEYVNTELMIRGIAGRSGRNNNFAGVTREIVDMEMAAHGGSVLEIRKSDGVWAVVGGSKYARRITAETPMRISGPAAGHAKMRTTADPDGLSVLGMLNNCGGGVTPWGTWLTCEENFNGYFWGKEAAEPLTDEARALRRYGAPSEWYAWGRFHDRFDARKEPNEPNRFGWVVEIDPFDPASVPVKRTALGRLKHEAAASVVNGDGRFVVYQGDDQQGEYVYRFVTEARVDLANPDGNWDILDRGVLSVARFDADGTGAWLPLVPGASPFLSEKFGFADQADIAIHTRLAASLVGATTMDRPEDVEVNPKTGRVYVMLTNNIKRTQEDVNAANPRPANRFGHIIEIMPDGGDHATATFRWEMLLRCGNPAVADVGATFNAATTANGWFANPDNCAFDDLGRLWVATDGNSAQKSQRSDGLWAVETEGAGRGTARCFFQVPRGAEMCGPCFTPDMETLFVAVQHPGETPEDQRDGGTASTFDAPTTRWPDFVDGTPPRPAVVAITRKGGGKIGV